MGFALSTFGASIGCVEELAGRLGLGSLRLTDGSSLSLGLGVRSCGRSGSGCGLSSSFMR